MDAGRTGARGGSVAVFAYGTLKQGFRNHAAYCSGFTQVHAARAWGRLYRWRPGIPILQVPEETVLLMGSKDVASDLEAAATLAAAATGGKGVGFSRPRWRRVRGEVLVFPDAPARLRILDAFEGFHPHIGERQYERVLLPVELDRNKEQLRAAWTYVMPFDQDPPSDRIPGDIWDPGMG